MCNKGIPVIVNGILQVDMIKKMRTRVHVVHIQ